MVGKTPKENFAEAIIRLIEGEDPIVKYSDQELGKYVKLLYRRFKLGFDNYYSDSFYLR